MLNGLFKLDKKRSVFLSQILFLKANINYTDVYLDGGKRITLAKTLKKFQEDIEDYGFLRINRQVIINSTFILNTDPEFQNVTLKDQSEFQISRRRRERFKGIFQGD